MTVSKTVLSSKEQVADHLAEHVFAAYEHFVSIKASASEDKKQDLESKYEYFNIAVSGGSIPELLWQGLSRKKFEINFKDWNVFFADERVCRLDDDDSTFKLFMDMKEKYMPSANFREHSVCSLDPEYVEEVLKASNKEELEESVNEVAEDYLKNMMKTYNPIRAVKNPMMHLILLGCGPDGHTCSLFPGYETIHHDKYISYVLDSPKPPPIRITMTLKTIEHARKVIFVATGKAKKDIIQSIFNMTTDVPCKLVNDVFQTRNVNCLWILDKEACPSDNDPSPEPYH